MHTKHALFGLIAVLLIGLLASCGWADGTRMWYRGHFEGPVDVRNRPQPGYYYRPSPNTTMPLFEQSYSYPLICSHCGAYYYPGKRCARTVMQSCPAGGRELMPGRFTLRIRCRGSTTTRSSRITDL